MLNEKNMTIEEILNYGIPYSDSIIIPNTVVEEMFFERKKINKQIERLNSIIINNVGEYGNVLSTTFKIKYKDGKRVISYDAKNFLRSLCNSFGIVYHGNLNDKTEYIKYIKNHIRTIKMQLKNVESVEEIKDLNPILYKNIKRDKYADLFNSKLVTKRYIDKFCESISKVSINLEPTCELLEMPLSYDVFDGVNKEKLLFYIACCSFTFTKYKSGESMHNGIYTAINYILEKGKDNHNNIILNNMSIVISDNQLGYNDRYSYKNFVTDCNQILKEYPSINEEIINPKRFEGKTIREINDYLELYRLTCGRTLDTNWELLPEGKREDNGVHYYKAKVRKNNKKIDSKVEKVYSEKIEFFENSEPLFRICGKDKFEGYSGFIYKNGLVFFEKIGSDDKIAKNTALYVMNIYNFIQFSQLTKQQIIEYNKSQDSNKIIRINHNNNWQNRAQAILNSNTDISMNDVNEIVQKQFVKKR